VLIAQDHGFRSLSLPNVMLQGVALRLGAGKHGLRRSMALNHAGLYRKGKPREKRLGRLPRPREAAALILRTQRDTPDRAFPCQADPPFRRAVGKVDHVDVAAERRDAPE